MLKYLDEFESCQLIEDVTYESIESTNAGSESVETVVEEGEFEEETVKLVSDRIFEQLD